MTLLFIDVDSGGWLGFGPDVSVCAEGGVWIPPYEGFQDLSIDFGRSYISPRHDASITAMVVHRHVQAHSIPLVHFISLFHDVQCHFAMLEGIHFIVGLIGAPLQVSELALVGNEEAECSVAGQGALQFHVVATCTFS